MPATQDPTPEQIAELCLQIQSTWSAQERMKRLRVDLRPTYMRCDGETEGFDAETYNSHHEQRAEMQEVAVT